MNLQQFGNQSGLLGGNGNGLANEAIQKETPVTRLEAALKRVRKASVTAACVADILVGERAPEAGCGSTGPIPAPSGIFGSVEEMADEIANLASEIISHISRIEGRL